MSEPYTQYESERELVDEFTRALVEAADLWGGEIDFAEEFYYLRGRTDVVAVTTGGEVIAFEAKLQNWREAMHQAYRNTCFAHFSYLILPCRVARRALRSDAELNRRGVGVCTVENGTITIAHPARKVQPIQPWLSHRAAAHASGNPTHVC